MTKTIDIEHFFKLRDELPVMDVRSPSEFAKGHIPKAVNIPLFSDEERADVGTRYKQISRESAINKGIEYAAENAIEYISAAGKLDAGKGVLVYCWRGGMRSLAICKLLNAAGIDTFRLEGGYKNYKQFIREQFKREITLIILGGMTGSGKTEKLLVLHNMGEQIIDLEGLAHHRGSAFGYFQDKPQPTNEQFENLLYEEWRKLDFSKPLWLEDESRMVGKVQINDFLFAKMRKSTVLKIIVKQEDRIKRLVKDYTDTDKQILLTAFNNISKRLGGLNYQLAVNALENNDFATAGELALRYYDKAYLHGLSKRNDNKIVEVVLENDEVTYCTKKIISVAHELGLYRAE